MTRPALTTVATLCAGLALATHPVSAALELEDCRLGEGASRVDAECGHLVVPEDHAKPDGRTLSLPVAVIRATSREPAADPLVLLAGGPGQAATEAFLPVLGALERINAERDLVLLDQRGTGKESLLDCPAFADPDNADVLDAAQSRRIAEQCIEQLTGSVDLSFYTTREAAQDLEALRIALGATKLNLYGASYGTRLAQVYATLYPEAVRSIVLDGVVPLDLAFGPRIGIDAQAALDRVLDRCAADPSCATRFPDLAPRLAAALAALDSAPRTVSTPHPRSGLATEVEVTREVAAQVLRLMTYAPETSALLPLIVDSIARGDLQALAGQWLVVGEGLIDSMNQALSLSVLCAEDAPFFDPQALAETASSYLRDDVPKALTETCPVWPTRPLPEGARQPFRSDIPTLLLSGENDPVTPPVYGDRVVATLTRARHLVAPGMGHNVLPRGCAPKLVAQFVDTVDPAGLDAACLDSLAAAAPFLSPAGPAPPPATTERESPPPSELPPLQEAGR